MNRHLVVTHTLLAAALLGHSDRGGQGGAVSAARLRALPGDLPDRHQRPRGLPAPRLHAVNGIFFTPPKQEHRHGEHHRERPVRHTVAGSL